MAENTRRIEPRDGVEVVVRDADHISVQQLRATEEDDERIVSVHPDDVAQLIEFLESAYEEAKAAKQEDRTNG